MSQRGAERPTLFEIPGNVTLKQLSHSEVSDEQERANARRKQGSRKSAARAEKEDDQIADICVFDGHAGSDAGGASPSDRSFGMFADVCEAAGVQCASSMPTNVLEVIRANADAAAACESVTDAAIANDSSRVLSVDAVKQRELERQKRADERVLRQRGILSGRRKARKSNWKTWAKGKTPLSFDLDGSPLTADERWEGTDAPQARVQEQDLAPEDPGPPGATRRRVTGIDPFIKYGYLPPLHKLFLKRVSSFYTPKMLRKVLVPLVDQSSDTALRQLDWLVTNFAKAKNLYVVGRDHQQRHVHTWYILIREALRKRHFEPFGKKWRVAFKVDDEYYRTTAGQAVFLMEAYNAGVLQYAKRHCAEIDMHLREQHMKRNERKAAAKEAGIRYKREPLTATQAGSMTVVEELSDAEDGDEFVEGDDVVTCFRKQQDELLNDRDAEDTMPPAKRRTLSTTSTERHRG